MQTTTYFQVVAFLCYALLFCSSQAGPPLDAAFKIPDALLLTGTIVPNPAYREQDDDQDACIITSLHGADMTTTSIGVQIQEGAFIFLVSCVYVLEDLRLADMSVVGEECDGFPMVPHGVEVASERLEFLLLEPFDEFWACWERGEALEFRVWVRGNEWH